MGTMLSLFAAGLLFIGLGLRSLFRRRLLRGGLNGLFGVCLALSGGLLALLMMNVQTYRQLTREIVLAEVSIGQATPDGVPLNLKTENSEQSYLVHSPEWRLDARFLKWKPWVSILGKDPLVRLERLEERGPGASSLRALQGYDLVRDERWLDDLLSQASRHAGLIDSLYGSSVYMPVRPGARYQVLASVSGLLARPVNTGGREAVIEWSAH